MTNWTTSLNKKKHQRKINHYMHILNKNIQDDELWQGRFYCHQVWAPQTRKYTDNSGMEYYVCIEFVDKATGDYSQTWRNVNNWCFLNGYALWQEMNDFVNECTGGE